MLQTDTIVVLGALAGVALLWLALDWRRRRARRSSRSAADAPGDNGALGGTLRDHDGFDGGGGDGDGGGD
ncbi:MULTISPECIES: hypothetical protein [Luteimonas]|uniref:hypothetical protein n=1 Tax=Luteimonas TaxID=83614 RepID=UPI000C7A4820|nr:MULTISPECIES: hypothetical protein [Luteimonas]